MIAVAASAKHDELEALGADIVLPRDSELTTALGKRTVDVVIDVVGGPAWPQLLEVLRPGGRYASSGVDWSRPAGASLGRPLDLRHPVPQRRQSGKDYLPRPWGTVLDPEVFANLVGYIERSEILPIVAAILPLHDIVAAQRLFLTKQHVGKIVLWSPPLRDHRRVLPLRRGLALATRNPAS